MYLALPYLLKCVVIPSWNSFDEYVNGAADYLKQIYNNQTMSDASISHRDQATNTYCMSANAMLPFQIPQEETLDYLLGMPASVFHGHGIRSYLELFLTANETSRKQMQPWRICQHELWIGILFAEYCIWIEEHEDSPSHYSIWSVVWILEGAELIWMKFIWRTLLSLYIVYVLWTRYYAHYIALWSNLCHVGFSKDYTRYEIVVGDPVSSMIYVTLGVMQVSQFDDIWVYFNGCLYLTRFVWLTYLSMRMMSFVIKRFKLEASFVPLDPGFLAIASVVYNGPVSTAMSTTKAVQLEHHLWCIGLTTAECSQAIDFLATIILVSSIWLTLPLLFSQLIVRCRRQKSNQVASCSPYVLQQKVSLHSYNDIKANILLSLTMRKRAKHHSGGELHKLYAENPRHRHLALFSHRAADSFVLCYTADGSLDQQVPLSLLSCLDPQLDDMKGAIPTCSSVHFNC
ncbi:hypothetical protein LEN26_003756, partial [Aphanomyces euteiches]